MSFEYIDRNTKAIRERIAAAQNSSPYDREVSIVAAVKYCEPGELKYLTEYAGITEIGENRVQQLLDHYEYIDREKVKIHFIGSLQTNKVKYIIDKVCMIHSLDSIKLATEIDKQAKKHGIVMDVLAEINCGREENKGGIMPEDVESFCREIMSFSSINLRGFMTMAPKCEEKSDYLKYFDETYKLFLDIWRKIVHNNIEPVVSMGMSESFEEAILCGSNIVRIGRGFFEK
ncbi:MAG: YggS family pyridoxal phosphate-dependent enzyme [Ruminococcaceae bacterium]|nr:YggS family pyridoxal phosphate-dependent enzyme [Oscillospiraceae bacterium]